MSRTDARTLARLLAIYALLVALSVVSVFPFLWSAATSLKTNEEVLVQPIRFLPEVWRFENYVVGLTSRNFPRYFFNSALMAVVVCVAHVVLASTAGYAFARLSFRHRDILFALVLATLMVPSQVTLVPLFIMAKQWPLLGGNDLLGRGGTGMMDNFWGLTVPLFATAYGTFLLRQFFQSLPAELEDAARIDGCSELGILGRIVLPLSGPALVTLAIFSFTATFNEFIWPLVITKSDAMRTVQLGLAGFRRETTTEWPLLMAVTLVATLPVLLAFVLGQRYFTRGIALTGLKG
jgi:multiple sugar transport system permease protein